jgi:hypothetical protein
MDPREPKDPNEPGEEPTCPGDPACKEDDGGSEPAPPTTCSFSTKFRDNLDLLNHSAIAGAAHALHYAEAAAATTALLLGTQVLSEGLRAGVRNPLAIETGVTLVSHAAARVPHIVGGVAVFEGGLVLGAALNAGAAVVTGSCQ